MRKYKVDSEKAEEFIHHEEILETIDYGHQNMHNRELIQQILDKARQAKGLTHREAMVLLASQEANLNQQIFNLAKELKQRFYGNRIVLFAPLYLSNYCVNECMYCPYHAKNKTIPRRKLTMDEIREEVISLQEMGHKRLALEMGEDPVHNSMDYLLEAIQTIYSVHHKNGDTRRVNVNVAATTIENYKKLKEAGIGTYILFQETYHKENYEKMHPKGPKSNYAYHTEAMDRAQLAGIDDVGCGVLFGLNNYEYDLVGLLMHAEHLEARFGVGPHTISVPRIRPADDIDPTAFDNSLNDQIFAKIVAIIRLAVPYTGMIMSTRESKKIRELVLTLGVSQISGGSKTSVGGYADKTTEAKGSEQFDIIDDRSLHEVVEWLLDMGQIPSFCTACYREGRTGDRFMALVKSGQIANICQPNALITLKEYLEDYASDEVREKGNQIIQLELNRIQNEQVKKRTTKWIKEIESGLRDVRF